MPTELPAARNGRTNTTDAHEADEHPIETEHDDVPTTGRSLIVLDPDMPATSLRAAFGHLNASDGALDLLVLVPTEWYRQVIGYRLSP